jgi:hypothetical protein
MAHVSRNGITEEYSAALRATSTGFRRRSGSGFQRVEGASTPTSLRKWWSNGLRSGTDLHAAHGVYGDSRRSSAAIGELGVSAILQNTVRRSGPAAIEQPRHPSPAKVSSPHHASLHIACDCHNGDEAVIKAVRDPPPQACWVSNDAGLHLATTSILQRSQA